MYLGIYEIDGDPAELLAAYDRLIGMMPEAQVVFHACAVREDGITVYDACPTKEVFEQFSTSPEFRGATEAAGLPWPRRSRDCHSTPYAPNASKGRHAYYLVNGSIAWLKSQVFWAMPEQLLAPPLPGQPPLSRWIAHADRVFTPLAFANATRFCASATVVTSVFFG